MANLIKYASKHSSYIAKYSSYYSPETQYLIKCSDRSVTMDNKTRLQS